MELARNGFKAALASGRVSYGLWASLASPGAVEIAGGSGADWVLIDMEHAPHELPDVIAALRALAPYPAAAVVRPPWNEAVGIKRLLDAGVQSLLLPFVQSVEEARAAVAATRYPPAGIRGVAGASRAAAYGRVPDYLHRAADQIAVVVQIESAAAVAAVGGIAAVEGVDGVFVGPSDLAASLGHLGQPEHPDVEAAIAEVIARVAPTGKPVGLFGVSSGHVRRAIALGVRFVSVASDTCVLRHGFDAAIAAVR